MPGPTAFQPDAFQNIAVLGYPDAFQVGPNPLAGQAVSAGGGGGMAGTWLMAPVGTGFDQAEGMLDLAARIGAQSGWWQDEEPFDWQQEEGAGEKEAAGEAGEEGSRSRTKTKTRFTEDLLFLFLAFNHALVLSPEARSLVREVLQDQWDAGVRDVSVVTKAVLDALGMEGDKAAKAFERVVKKYRELKVPPELREDEEEAPTVVIQPMPVYPAPYLGPQLPASEDKKLLSRPVTFAVGIVAGLAVAYVAYRLYQAYQETDWDGDDEDDES